jgi:hypothetical protein
MVDTLNNVYDYRMDLYVPCLSEDTRQPRRHYFLLETAYEGEHNSTPDRIRRQAYWPLLCGAFGQLYGNSPIWHFGSVGVYDRGGDWVAALDSQGARDIAHLARMLRSRPWWLLRADHEHRVVIARRRNLRPTGLCNHCTNHGWNPGALIHTVHRY